MSLRWDTARLGCIQREGFKVQPAARTAQTRAGSLPIQSRTADLRAPLACSFVCMQTRAQFGNFRQWVDFDLEGGARPFVVELWLYGMTRRVRARMLGPWSARREAFDTWQTSGVFEIERESLWLDFENSAGVSPGPPLRESTR